MKLNVYICMFFFDIFFNFNVLIDLKKNNNNILCCYKFNDCLIVLWVIFINFFLLFFYVFVVFIFVVFLLLGFVIIVYRFIYI